MSGQPYKYASDVDKFRNEYLQTLGLQADINQMNLEANKTYKETGQLPPVSQMKDTRTTAEILADTERLKQEIIKDFEGLGDVNFRMAIIQRLQTSPLNADGSLFSFVAQRAPEIALHLKKQYKYGIKGDQNDVSQFVAFIEDMYSKTKSFTSTVTSYFSKGGMSQQLLNSGDLDAYAKILQDITLKLSLISGPTRPYTELQESLKYVADLIYAISKCLSQKDYLDYTKTLLESRHNTTDFYSIMDADVFDRFFEVYKSYYDFIQKLPKSDTVYTMIKQLENAMTNKNESLSFQILENLISLLMVEDRDAIDRINFNISELVKDIKTILKQNQKVGDITITGAQKLFSERGEEIVSSPQYKQYEERIDSLYSEIKKLEKEERKVLRKKPLDEDKLEEIRAKIEQRQTDMQVLHDLLGKAGYVYGEEEGGGGGGGGPPMEHLLLLANGGNPLPEFEENQQPSLTPSQQSTTFSSPPQIDLMSTEQITDLIKSKERQIEEIEENEDYSRREKMKLQEPIKTELKDLRKILVEKYRQQRGEEPEEEPEPQANEEEPEPQHNTEDEIERIKQTLKDIAKFKRENAEEINVLEERIRNSKNPREINEYIDIIDQRQRDDKTVNLESKRLIQRLKELQQRHEEGHGLPKRRGRPKGSGIAKPYNHSVVQHAAFDKGIESSPRFVKFGNYLVNLRKLHNEDILALKTGKGFSVQNLPSKRLSKNLSGIIKKMIGGSVLSYAEINSLSEPEKIYLHNVAKKANIQDKFTIPAPSMEKRDKDIHDFEVMKGEIMAGNDNKDLIKKFKIHILRLSKEGVLPKKEVAEIMEDLLELGI